MEEMTYTHFCLFANCLPVKGASRSLICDVQRHDYDFIPNELYDMLTQELHKPIAEIAGLFGEENRATITEYFEYLEEKEYGFFCTPEEQKLFPPMSMEWDHASPVTNAILDIDEQSDFEDIGAFVTQLDELMCQSIDIRMYHAPDEDFLHWLMGLFSTHTIESITLYFKWGASHTEALYTGLKRYLRLKRVIIHSCQDTGDYAAFSQNNRLFYFTDKVIDSDAHCGVVLPAYFSSNKILFTEGQNHNTCLNRKVSLDCRGNLCQCPSMQERFGHVKTTRIAHVIGEQKFTDVWSITKDQVEVCRDCEFRYICTDCRAWRNSEDLKSKPAKCHYNPYTAEWETVEITERETNV